MIVLEDNYSLLPDMVYSYEETIEYKKNNNISYKGIIYCTVNLLNGHIYIGKDELNRKNYYGSGKHFVYALKKYGKENFEKFIIDISAKNIQELDELEKRYIKPHLHKTYCYNIAPGGEGPTWWKSISKERYDEIRHNMSIGGKGKKLSSTHIEKMRIAAKGRHHTEETKERIRQKNTGKKFSEEWRRHISESAKGRKMSDETKKKISLAVKGRPCKPETKEKLRIANTGKHLTEEQRKKLSLSKLGCKDSEETRRKKSISHKKLYNTPEWHKRLSENTKHRNEICGNPMSSPKARQKLRRTLYKKKLLKQGYSLEEAISLSLEKFPLI